MKILLLSDTHGYIDDRILHYVAQVDEVWHAGDIGPLQVTDALEEIKPLRAVYGNIDGAEVRQRFPLHQRFVCEEVVVWMTHIGGYPGRYSAEVKAQIYKDPPQLFISGHSHILKVMRDNSLDLLHLNPGAVGMQGWHQVRTMLRFEISGRAIQNLEVIEWKKK